MIVDGCAPDVEWRMPRFAPINFRRERLVHVVLKAYFDGSADGKRETAITLTGVAATEYIWSEFEAAWAAVISKYSVSGLHMAALMGFHGEFSEWDETRRSHFLQDLWNTVGSFRGQHLVAHSCTVKVPDWRRAKLAIPSLCSPQSICVNYCVGGLHLPEECVGDPHPVILYFDRTEDFMHKVNRVWLRRRKQRGTLFRQIHNIILVDATERPIQLADMLAWIANSDACEKAYPQRASFGIDSILMIEHFRDVYDYDKILLRYPNGRLVPE